MLSCSFLHISWHPVSPHANSVASPLTCPSLTSSAFYFPSLCLLKFLPWHHIFSIHQSIKKWCILFRCNLMLVVYIYFYIYFFLTLTFLPCCNTLKIGDSGTGWWVEGYSGTLHIPVWNWFAEHPWLRTTRELQMWETYFSKRLILFLKRDTVPGWKHQNSLGGCWESAHWNTTQWLFPRWRLYNVRGSRCRECVGVLGGRGWSAQVKWQKSCGDDS